MKENINAKNNKPKSVKSGGSSTKNSGSFSKGKSDIGKSSGSFGKSGSNSEKAGGFGKGSGKGYVANKSKKAQNSFDDKKGHGSKFGEGFKSGSGYKSDRTSKSTDGFKKNSGKFTNNSTKSSKGKERLQNKTVKVTESCIGLSEEGKGIIRVGRDEINVPYLIEGEKAFVEVKFEGRHYNTKILSLLNRSKDRVEPKCPYFYKCGGCQLQHMSYEAQLSFKEGMVRKLMKPYGKVSKIISMNDPYNYRNKAHSTFASYKKGEVISGIYEEYTHTVIPIDHCMIQDPIADKIFETIRGLVKSFKIRPYDEDSREGFLRHVLIRTGFISGEVMVVFVVSDKVFPSKNNLMRVLLEKHPEITTVVMNINDKDTTMVLGDREIVLYGDGMIQDTLLGLKFKLSPKSFYQINHEQTEKLYSAAIKMADLNKDEIVLDAYSGIGTIGLIVSAGVKEVIGVELNKDAVQNAMANAKLNNIKNAKFYQGDAGDFMIEMAEQNLTIDTVFIDPPRSGSDEKFLSSIVKLHPKKLVYISCNPVTQARDVEYLVKNGYKVDAIQPVDLFCQTYHVENIVKLSYK